MLDYCFINYSYYRRLLWNSSLITHTKMVMKQLNTPRDLRGLNTVREVR